MRELPPSQTAAPWGTGLRPIGRRDALRALGLGLGTAALAALAGCEATQSTQGKPSASTASGTPAGEFDWAGWWSEQQQTGIVDFANWPYYIDRQRDNSHPSLELFTKQTGIDVNYYRPVRGNAEFLEQARPGMEAGTPEWDLVVVTNGPQLSTWMENGWFTPLDHDQLPNFQQHAGPLVQGPAWDPENRYTIAWQSGFTGIGFRPEAVEALGREPRSVWDLWNPALKGRVGMMSDLLELGSLGLLAIGVDPPSSSLAEWKEAAAVLERQHQEVSPRYYDQGYLNALGRGDVWISMAWSGDIFQLNQLGHPELRFVMPDEGAMFWTDNMAIPLGAAHPADAIALMDFVYRPPVAAMIADWVWYVSPVPAAKPIIAQRLDDPVVAHSPLVFPELDTAQGGASPGEEGLGRLRDYYVFERAEDYSPWRDLFSPIAFS